MNDIFRSIRNWLNPPQENAPAYTESQIAALSHLRSMDEWDVFLDVLDRTTILYADHLLAPSADDRTVHFLRGKIAGLREAPALVAKILTQETHAREAERRHAAAHAGRAAVERRRALYGTPSWNESVRK